MSVHEREVGCGGDEEKSRGEGGGGGEVVIF